MGVRGVLSWLLFRRVLRYDYSCFYFAMLCEGGLRETSKEAVRLMGGLREDDSRLDRLGRLPERD